MMWSMCASCFTCKLTRNSSDTRTVFRTTEFDSRAKKSILLSDELEIMYRQHDHNQVRKMICFRSLYILIDKKTRKTYHPQGDASVRS